MQNVAAPAGSVLAPQALVIARGYADAGTHEEGGNNRGDQVEYFQRLLGGAPGDPWCADFVCCCLVKAYAQLTRQPEGRADLPHYLPAVRSHYLNLSGYCPALWSDAVARKIAQGRDFAASPGDLVLFDFGNVGEPHHIEFVLNWPRRRTIGGNTRSGDSGNQGDGDGVFRRTRPAGPVFGFIRLAG